MPPGAQEDRVCQFHPRSMTLKCYEAIVAIMATEMAENKYLVSELAQESAAQWQCHLDQHIAHMAVLVQMAGDMEVVAILQDIADNVHERVALLRSSLGYLSQE